MLRMLRAIGPPPIMVTRTIAIVLLGLTIIVATLLWAGAGSFERSAVKVGVRRCLSTMITAGTYATNAEARIREDIAEMQELWGISARQAVKIECGERH